MRIICDKCEKPFEVDAQPGDKVECPICGDVNIVRAGGAPVPSGAPREDLAAAAGYPPAFGPEADVLRLRPAMFRAKPFRFVLLTLVVLAGAIGAMWFISSQKPWAAACGIGAVLAGVFFLVWRINTLNDGLLVTTRRIIDRTGILSKRTSEVMFKDIRHVVVKQSFFERLMNVGTLEIASSSDDGVAIFMEHLAKPEEVKRVIDLYR